MVLMYGVAAEYGDAHAGEARASLQRVEEPHDAPLVTLRNHVVERFEPLAGFNGLEGRRINRRQVLHEGSARFCE